jgi:hypothetical protein
VDLLGSPRWRCSRSPGSWRFGRTVSPRRRLCPAEQARIIQLLVERVDVQGDAIEVRIRTEGLMSVVGELRQQSERQAA